MRTRIHLILAAAAVLAAFSCTKPPYQAPDRTQAQVESDFQDCYSGSALAAETPPYPSDIDAAVAKGISSCMAGRGFQPKLLRW